MRCIIVFVILIGSFHSYQSHSRPTVARVPEFIIQKLDSIFPDSHNVEWTKIRSAFRADFMYGNLTISMTFDRSGVIMKSTEELNPTALPHIIKDKIEKDFAFYKILIILKKQQKKRCEYEVEIIKGEYHRMLVFNEKGSRLFTYELVKEDLYVDIN